LDNLINRIRKPSLQQLSKKSLENNMFRIDKYFSTGQLSKLNTSIFNSRHFTKSSNKLLHQHLKKTKISILVVSYIEMIYQRKSFLLLIWK